jgi:hypothetical protein
MKKVLALLFLIPMCACFDGHYRDHRNYDGIIIVESPRHERRERHHEERRDHNEQHAPREHSKD